MHSSGGQYWQKYWQWVLIEGTSHSVQETWREAGRTEFALCGAKCESVGMYRGYVPAIVVI